MRVVVCDSVVHLSISGPHECDSQQKKEKSKIVNAGVDVVFFLFLNFLF